jgi:succinate dehydrogenase / fumarate reductase flavoprotein subunit
MHGSNRLGGNSLSDLLVFGQRAGEAAAASALGNGHPTSLPDAWVAESVAALDEPFERTEGEDPHRLHEDLQGVMQTLVGIFRTREDLEAAIVRLDEIEARWPHVRVTGPRSFNSTWDLVFELRNMLTASEAVARSALLREESRGAHSRLDFPAASGEWDHVNVAVGRDGDDMAVRLTETVTLPDDLRVLVTK